MVRTKKISAKELPELIRISYEGDAELLATQHVQPMPDIETAVEMTKSQIELMATEKDLTYYKVIVGKRPAGYFATFDNFLFSFGINKEFRKKEVLIGWWGWVKKSLSKNFLCLLYTHQTKAIKFLQKNGMVITEVDNANNCVILIHKN